jgi:hypothetical protein
MGTENTTTSAPVKTEPTPLEDLEKRLKLLQLYGVRSYNDGPLQILLAPPRPQAQQLTEDELIARLQEIQTRGE